MADTRKIIPVRIEDWDWLRKQFDPHAAKAGLGRAPFIVKLMEAYVEGRLVWADPEDAKPEWQRKLEAAGHTIANDGELRAHAFRRMRPRGIIGSGKPEKPK